MAKLVGNHLKLGKGIMAEPWRNFGGGFAEPWRSLVESLGEPWGNPGGTLRRHIFKKSGMLRLPNSTGTPNLRCWGIFLKKMMPEREPQTAFLVVVNIVAFGMIVNALGMQCHAPLRENEGSN